MADTTPCPRCGTAAFDEERLALGGNCPACLAQDLLGPAEWELARPATDSNRLGPYCLRRKLGEGGMGAVYLAEDSRSGRTVAVKVLPKRQRGDEENVKRFRREARAAIRLSHPNLARGYETGEDRGHPYYVMEYCEGETLEKLLDRKPRLPWREAVRIAMAVARALGHALANGLIHRDVKPANIVLTKEGVPKLLDLGIAKELAESSFRTQTGVVLGTPQYLSPEQARGDAIDGRSDLFSLGATLYHLVTGQVPFNASTLIEVVAQHLSVEIPDPRTHARDLPEPLVLLLQKMLSKDPADRPRNAEELGRDLARVLQGKAPTRRRPYLLAGAAAAAVITIATILVWPSAEPLVAPSPPEPQKTPIVGPRPLPPTPAAQRSPVAAPTNNSSIIVDLTGVKWAQGEDKFGWDDTNMRLYYWSNGTGEFTVKVPADGDFQIVVTASSQPALNEHAKFKVAADGKPIGAETTCTSKDPKEYSFFAPLSAGDRKISITYTNDVYSENEYDRNFHLNGLKLVWVSPGPMPPMPAPPPGANRGPVVHDPLDVAGSVSNEGLVGYWTFDEEGGLAAKDSSGHGNHGTRINEPKSVPGIASRALEFDCARNQRVVVPHHDSLNLTRSFTLAAWVKPTARTGYQQGIIEKFSWVSVEAQGGYFLRLNKERHPGFGVIPASGGARGPFPLRSVPLNTWTHVAGVYDATKNVARIYMNGNRLAEEANIQPSTESDQPLHLGADYGDNRFHGFLDEIRIYNRALSPDEIRSLAGEKTVESRPEPPAPPRTEVRGEPVDLLPLIDLKQDAVKGAWTRSGKELITPLDSTENRVRIRYSPGDEYDLVAVVRREDGSNCLAFLLAVPAGQFMVALDGWDHGDRTALCGASGKEDRGRNSTTHTGTLLAKGKTTTIRFEVRRDGVRLWVDDQSIFSWKGDPSRLPICEAWEVPQRNLIHVGNSWSKFRILSLTLTPIRTQ